MEVFYELLDIKCHEGTREMVQWITAFAIMKILELKSPGPI